MTKEQALYNLSVMSTPGKDGLYELNAPFSPDGFKHPSYLSLTTPPHKEGYQSNPPTPLSDTMHSDLATPIKNMANFSPQAHTIRSIEHQLHHQEQLLHRGAFQRSLIPSFNNSVVKNSPELMRRTPGFIGCSTEFPATGVMAHAHHNSPVIIYSFMS